MAASAKLSDGKKTVTLPLNPESAVVSISGDYAINAVLDTFKPLVRRKASTTTYNLGKILLYSFAGDVDFYPTYLTLKYWASTQVRLKYTSDIHTVPTCYISALTMEPKRWLGSKLLQAEMTIELIEAGVEPKATKEAKPAKVITAREQANKKATILKKLKTPTKQKALKISSSFDVEVDDQNIVAIITNEATTEYDYDTLIGVLG